MHSGGFELAKMTYTRLEDNLIRHRGDRQPPTGAQPSFAYIGQKNVRDNYQHNGGGGGRGGGIFWDDSLTTPAKDAAVL